MSSPRQNRGRVLGLAGRIQRPRRIWIRRGARPRTGEDIGFWVCRFPTRRVIGTPNPGEMGGVDGVSGFSPESGRDEAADEANVGRGPTLQGTILQLPWSPLESRSQNTRHIQYLGILVTPKGRVCAVDRYFCVSHLHAKGRNIRKFVLYPIQVCTGYQVLYERIRI